MFASFFKKKLKKRVDAPALFVDIHSHLIPGIDDGAKTLEESMSLLKGLAALGYTKVITTPHVMSDYYKNTFEIIQAGKEVLQKEIDASGLKIEIEVAAEYYMDDKFYDEMKKENILSIDNQYVLFETSYMSKPLQLEEMIFAIGEAGYRPLMAHPERYRYIKDPQKEYKRFKDLGVLFQVNLNSFGGHYGRGAEKLAHFLNDAGMIDFIGSDLHHQKQMDTLAQIHQTDIYCSIFENNTIMNNSLV